MKNKSGITLIALIITIVVMMILVGVTVAIAINGGLFKSINEAVIKRDIAKMQENLLLKRRLLAHLILACTQRTWKKLP